MLNFKAFSEAVNDFEKKIIFVPLIITLLFWYLIGFNSYWVILPIITTIITLILMCLITFQTIKMYNDIKFLNRNLSDGIHIFSLKEKDNKNLNHFAWGNRKEWDKTDSNKIVIGILNGQFDGSYEEYNNKGNIELKGNYREGSKYGFWEYFDNEGNIKHRGNYDNGKKHGLWKYYKSGVFKNELEFHFGSEIIQISELKKNTDSYDQELIDKNLFSISDGKRTEYYNSGSIRMINYDNTYSFYLDNELNDPIKKCEIIIEIDKVLNDRYSYLQAFEPVLKGIWSNFRIDGSLDYQLDFSEYTKNNKKCNKISYDLLGNEISSEPKSVKFPSKSIMLFHSYYKKDRLIEKVYESFVGTLIDGGWVVNENIKYFHQYDNGVMGPPGAGIGRVVINSVLDIEDIIELK